MKAIRQGFRVFQMGVDYFPRTRGISTLASPQVIVKMVKRAGARCTARRSSPSSRCSRCGCPRRCTAALRPARKADGGAWRAVIRLVVNADDLGLHPRIDEGIFRAHARGHRHQRHAAGDRRAARARPRARAQAAGSRSGCTCCLTAQLHAGARRPRRCAGWRPAAASQRLGGARRGVAVGLMPADEVALELRAQLERARSWAWSLDHLDVHQHVHLLPGLARVVEALARERSCRCGGRRSGPGRRGCGGPSVGEGRCLVLGLAALRPPGGAKRVSAVGVFDSGRAGRGARCCELHRPAAATGTGSSCATLGRARHGPCRRTRSGATAGRPSWRALQPERPARLLAPARDRAAQLPRARRLKCSRRCPTCKAAVRDTDKFCSYCKCKLPELEAAVPTESPPVELSAEFITAAGARLAGWCMESTASCTPSRSRPASATLLGAHAARRCRRPAQARVRREARPRGRGVPAAVARSAAAPARSSRSTQLS